MMYFIVLWVESLTWLLTGQNPRGRWGCLPSGDARGSSVSWPFSASADFPWSLTWGPGSSIFRASDGRPSPPHTGWLWSSIVTSPSLPPSCTFEDPRDYTGPICTIQHNLKRRLTSNLNSVCNLRSSLPCNHRAWTLGCGYLGGVLFCLLDSVICCSVISVAQSCPTLHDPMDCNTPGFPVFHHLEFAQTHVHWVGYVIQPSYPQSSPSPPALNLSQHQDSRNR